MRNDILQQHMEQQVQQLAGFMDKPLGDDALFYHFQIARTLATAQVGQSEFAIKNSDPQAEGQIVLELPAQPFIARTEEIQTALQTLSGSGVLRRGDIDSGQMPIFNTHNQVLVGADTIPHLKIDGENKIIHVRRDLGAPVFGGYFSCPGGVVTESPSRTHIKEINEELGLIVEEFGRYHLLLLSHRGETGISVAEKAAQIETLREHASARYPNFDASKDITVTTIKCADVSYAAWKPVQIVTRWLGEEVDRFAALPTLVPSRSAMVLLSPIRIPERVTGLSVMADLREGKNCFMVDAEKFVPKVGRDMQAFTPAEMLTIRDKGFYFDNLNIFCAGTELAPDRSPVKHVMVIKSPEGILAPL